MDAVRPFGTWLMAALVLGGCASARDAQEATWPEWRAPTPAPATVAAPEPAGAPVYRLPEGRLGLRPADAAHGREVAVRAPWGELPVHGKVFHFLAHVYEAPREGARAVGYMRRGALLRASEASGYDGCESGWHAVWGGGYVCRDQGYRLSARAFDRDVSHPAPNRADPLPYDYAKVVSPAVQTWRVPTPEEDERLRELLANARTRSAVSDGGAPSSVADAGLAAAMDAGDAGAGEDALPSWVRMLDERGHYLSLAGEVLREDGRVFLRTVRGAYVPKDATLPVEPSAFVGRQLAEGDTLPVAVALRDAGRVAPGIDGSIRELPSLVRGEVLSLTGSGRSFGARRFLEARDGTFVDGSRVVVVRPHERPALVPRGARWVHVDVGNQTLTAYEGERAVYVTLVSTGKAGFDTPEGLHRIHAKHVTATMDDTALSEGAYYIEDVPWTMYFQGSYALHAAFWHERFGRPRSHGCVNLAPRDAHWLFEFLTPVVPGGRHGVLVPGEEPSFVLVESGDEGSRS